MKMLFLTLSLIGGKRKKGNWHPFPVKNVGNVNVTSAPFIFANPPEFSKMIT